MVAFYVYRVIHGLKKWTDIPFLWKQDVVNALKEQRYTLNDDGTVSKNE